MRDGGKGDLRRPLMVSEEQFNEAWERIFNTKEKQQLKQAFADVLEEHKELLNDLSDHEKECGK
jgi:CelD/BcsL family acetyltransferase involved in cellulose biosynthesis